MKHISLVSFVFAVMTLLFCLGNYTLVENLEKRKLGMIQSLYIWLMFFTVFIGSSTLNYAKNINTSLVVCFLLLCAICGSSVYFIYMFRQEADDD